MNASVAARAIWWKESRQLLPLAYVLIGTALFTYLIASVSAVGIRENLHWALFSGLPSLFAVGAGALVVGQEKELRTLQWLNSLPVSIRAVVRTKLLVGLLGLALLWLVSVALAALFDSPVLYPSASENSKVWVLLASSSNTLFLLVAGFALAWRLNSSLWSLVLLAVVAIIPHAIASTIAWATNQVSQNPNDWFLAPPKTLFAVQLGCTIVALVIANLLGKRAFDAAKAPRVFSQAQHARPKRRYINQPFPSPFRALTWQWFQQNKALLIVSLVVACGLCGIVIGSYDVEFVTGGGASLVWLVLACALGVSVFQSDDLHDRIRFFADRGISPSLAWLSRIIWPAAIFAAVGLSLFLCMFVFQQPSDWFQHRKLFWLNLGMVGAGGLVAFCVSLWVGQLIFSPIVAIVAAPAASAAAIGIGAFTIDTYGTPIWLAILGLLILPLASLMAMRDWMDRRKRFAFWSKHMFSLIAMGILFVMPLAWVVLFEPGMSTATRNEITVAQREVKFLRDPYGPLELYVPSPGVFDVNSRANDSDINKAKEFQGKGAFALEGHCLDSIVRQLEDTDRTISPTRVVDFLTSSLKLNRLRIRSFANVDSQSLGIERPPAPEGRKQVATPSSDSEQNIQEPSEEDFIDRYNELFQVSRGIVERVRKGSRNLKDLDATDVLEFSMLKEISLRETKELLNPEVYRQAVETLANLERRRNSRKNAILQAMHYEGIGYDYSFAGYVLPDSDLTSVLARIREVRRRSRNLFEPLWLCASRPEQDSTDLRRQIADFMHCSPAYYGFGDGGRLFRGSVSEASPQVLDCPGALWNAEWEKLALELPLQIE